MRKAALGPKEPLSLARSVPGADPGQEESAGSGGRRRRRRRSRGTLPASPPARASRAQLLRVSGLALTREEREIRSSIDLPSNRVS